MNLDDPEVKRAIKAYEGAIELVLMEIRLEIKRPVKISGSGVWIYPIGWKNPLPKSGEGET